MTDLINGDYTALLGEIKDHIRSAQYEALRAVNKQLISLYWDIGRLIVERQRVAGWGHSVVEQLAADVRTEFPGIQGFSAANVWRMKSFYETYAGNEKLAPMVRECSWTHNLVIVEKCKDDLEREFYLRMTKAYGWTKNVLIHQIENQTYQKRYSGRLTLRKRCRRRSAPRPNSRSRTSIRLTFWNSATNTANGS